MNPTNDTIVAIATGAGGALAVIRVSGPQAITVCGSMFRPASGEPLSAAKGYTLHYGEIADGEGHAVDDVIVSVFRSPRSFTGEDMAEISCHGSRYVQQKIMQLLIDAGCRQAEPGEFTVRAYLAGKMDLAQAEAIADMIASGDRAAHALAVNQMRGGYSHEFTVLRGRLIELVALLELELDFGEEDVEFADRTQLLSVTNEISGKVNALLGSFRQGNAIKEGIAVAIVGSPNVGKSTLLNTLLRDDRAMVSDIAGTTRDIIEEAFVINGVRFRFIDTAGIRETSDTLERMGIKRTFESLEKSDIVILVAEAGATPKASADNINDTLAELPLKPHQRLCIVLNKSDRQGLGNGAAYPAQTDPGQVGRLIGADIPLRIIPVSAKTGANIDSVLDFLYEASEAENVFKGDPIVSNSRHYESLSRAADSLERVKSGLGSDLAADLVSQDIRETIHYLGSITGAITTDEILGNIFSKFCIGK